MIEFHLDTRSGVSPYLQLVQQVRQALRLGSCARATSCRRSRTSWRGWRSTPTPSCKAYRELEHDGLVAARPGVGTFVTRTLSDAIARGARAARART